MVQFRLVDLARLQGQLNQGILRQKDEPTFQVISQLISAVKQVQDTINFNISTFSAGLNVSAGTSSRVVTQLIFSNQNSVSFGLSNNTITASANPGILFSASGSSGRFTALTFSNSNGITFGNSNGVITASAASGSNSINVSAGTTSNNLTKLVFSNSNGVSFGLNGSTITGSIAAANSLSFSAGTSSIALNSLVFSNSENVSFGLSGSTVTASAGFVMSAGTTFGTVTGSLIFSDFNNVSFGISNNSILTASASFSGGGGGFTLSYYENQPFIDNTLVVGTNIKSELFVQPIVVPYNVSGSFIRNIVSISNVNAQLVNTTSNTSFSLSQADTIGLAIYTRMTGASSNSLQTIFTTSAGRSALSSLSANSNGSEYTWTINYSYPLSGANSTFSTTYAATSTVYRISSNPMSRFHGMQWFDIPFATLLTPNQYWVGFGYSSTSSNNGPAGAAIATQGYSSIMISQVATIPKTPGNTANSDFFQPGVGIFTTNAALFTTASFNLSDIGSRAGNDIQPLWIYKI